MRESKIDQYLRIEIEKMDGLYIKTEAPGNNGWFDRYALFHGNRAFLLEAKATGKRPRKLQEWQHNRARERGAETRVVNSIELAKKFIDEIRTTPLPGIRTGTCD